MKDIENSPLFTESTEEEAATVIGGGIPFAVRVAWATYQALPPEQKVIVSQTAQRAGRTVWQALFEPVKVY